jgi:large subunit ribosomal protein L15
VSAVLSNLAPPEGARSSERRVGRGPGCRKGKMSGRGFKGQKARRGGNLGKLQFQGGQTPLQRRLPKRGFNVPFITQTGIVNVGALQRFEAGTVVDIALLESTGLVRGRFDRVKILGEGDLSTALTVRVNGCSAQATAKIQAAGGSVEIVASEPVEAAADAAE